MSRGFFRNAAVALGVYCCASFGQQYFTIDSVRYSDIYGPLNTQKKDNLLEKTVKLYYNTREKYDNLKRIKKEFKNCELEIKLISRMGYEGIRPDFQSYVGGVKLIMRF